MVQGFMSLPSLEDNISSRLADPKTWTQDAPHSIKIVAFSSKALSPIQSPACSCKEGETQSDNSFLDMWTTFLMLCCSSWHVLLPHILQKLMNVATGNYNPSMMENQYLYIEGVIYGPISFFQNTFRSILIFLTSCSLCEAFAGKCLQEVGLCRRETMQCLLYK